MTLFALFQLIFIAVVTAYLSVNLVYLVRLPQARGPLGSTPPVSVCVPARNEERDIEACLLSLLAQDYPDMEIIVVDDHSTDRTPALLETLKAQHPQLIVLKSEALPEGWYGKPFALHQAARRARGELLLLTDADPVFAPHAITSAVHWMTVHRLDLLSLMPAAEFGSFWERAVQPLIFAFIAGLTRFRKVNSPDSPSAMGVGAFLMVRREVYEGIGGHEPLRQTILEDIGMARRVKGSGGKVMIADAKNHFRIRMYHSLGEIWRGWRKNIFLAFRSSIPRTLYYVTVLLLFVVAPWLTAAYHLWAGSPPGALALAGAGWGLSVLVQAGLCTELGLKPWRLLLFPPGALVASAIILNSMIHILFRGRSEWRGRTYSRPTG